MKDYNLIKKYPKLTELMDKFMNNLSTCNYGEAINTSIEINKLIHQDVEDCIVDIILEHIMDFGCLTIKMNPITINASMRTVLKTGKPDSINVYVASNISSYINKIKNTSYGYNGPYPFDDDDDDDITKYEFDDLKISIDDIVTTIKTLFTDLNNDRSDTMMRKKNKINSRYDYSILIEDQKYRHIIGSLMIIDMLLALSKMQFGGVDYESLYNFDINHVSSLGFNNRRSGYVETMPNKIFKQKIKIDNIDVESSI